MYADRPHLSHGPRPVSFGASLAISSGIMLALIYAAPEVTKKAPPGVIDTYDVPLPPEPKPEPEPRPETELRRETQIVTPPVQQPIPQPDAPPISTTTELPATPPPIPGTPDGGGTAPAVEPKPAPLLLVAATLDPRYAGALQPEYPGIEIRNEREGRVTVRVLIGTDGRVKQVEKVSATSDAFYESTRDRALKRWRFKPATRGGIPEESWKQMSVRFELKSLR